MKIFAKITLTVLVIIILFIAGAAFYITRGLDSGSKLVIGKVNPELLNNGTYNGRYNAGRWTNEISVVIEDHKITRINIVKDVKFPNEDVTKKLFDRVIEKQNSNVDAVSGATVTSKAYLKAIENALKR